jgi:hypothetical protein
MKWASNFSFLYLWFISIITMFIIYHHIFITKPHRWCNG